MTQPRKGEAQARPASDSKPLGQITDDVLAAMFKGAPYLNLTNNPVTDKGMATLVEHGKALRTLYLVGCSGITAEGFRLVARLPALEILYVSGSQLTDEVVEALKACPVLRRIEVVGDAVAGGRALTGLKEVLRRRLADK